MPTKDFLAQAKPVQQQDDFLASANPSHDAPPPDERNGVQRVFDDLTTVTPEQEQGKPWLVNKAQEFGAGTIGSLSPVFHPEQTVEGLLNAVSDPEKAAKGIWADAKEHPAQTLGNLVGGAVTGGLASEAGGGLLAKIPTKAKAGALFESVMKDAADQPLTLTRTEEPLRRAMEMAKAGGTTPKVVNQLARRIGATAPNARPLNLLQKMENDLGGVTPEPPTPEPISYREARDFGPNLSEMSSEEKSTLKPSMRRQVGKISKAFNADTADAAGNVGRADDFMRAMRTYRTAARIGDTVDALKKWSVPAAATAVGAGGIAKLISALRQ